MKTKRLAGTGYCGRGTKVLRDLSLNARVPCMSQTVQLILKRVGTSEAV